MRRYTAADEVAVRLNARVRDWKASGLIDAEHSAALERELQTGFRRTHWALRAVLFVFSIFVIQSAIGLVVVIARPDDEAVVATLALLAGVACYVMADVSIARFRLYRFGIEEACVVCSIALLTGGVTLFASVAGLRGDALVLVAFLMVAAAGLVAYWRFGLLYCAIAAIASAAGVAFFLDLTEMSARVVAAVVLMAIHAIATMLRRRPSDDYPGDDYAAIEAVTWLGLYVALNLELVPRSLGHGQGVAPSFYWATYIAVWLLPAVGLYRGVDRKHRWMIRAGLLMALATLVTNKSYLGWERHTWDPIVLGLLLIATALGVRRWLLTGDETRRRGFTPHRLLSLRSADDDAGGLGGRRAET